MASLPPSKRKKVRPTANNNTSIVTSNGPSLHSAKTEKRVVISHCSHLAPINLPGNGILAGPIFICADPTSGCDPYVRALGGLYDKYIIRSCTVHYLTALGTTRDGMIAFGFDGEFSPTMSRQQVSSLDPSVRGPIWQCTSITIPQKQLRVRDVFKTRFPVAGPPSAETLHECTPGNLMIAVDGPNGTFVGDFWIEYQMEFFSPSGGAA